MSLDKLKSSWDSLDDSLDPKEIVTLRNLRKNSYNIRYKGLKTYRNFDLACFPILLVLPLPHICFGEINVLALIVYYVISFFMMAITYIVIIKFKRIKMCDDTHALKERFYDYLKYNKMYNKIGLITLPIYCINFNWMLRGTTAILENPFEVMIIPLLFMFCCGGAIAFYIINRVNKRHKSMLEDIKQLEELDI